MSRNLEMVIFSVLLVFWAISCGQPSEDKLSIATAANMRFAIEDLVKAFSDNSGIECELIISSSGTLTAQIMEGAPYDVFVAANMNYPQKLFSAGFSEKEPEIYASGHLVLWTMKDSLPGVYSLTGNDVRHIAIANPRLAPYGMAAIDFLKQKNIFESVESKLVFGESLSQTNQFIVSKAADVGITSLSTVLSPGMQDKGQWLMLDTASYRPIRQGVVLVNRKSSEIRQKQARQFYDFLFSKRGEEILERFGYSTE